MTPENIEIARDRARRWALPLSPQTPCGTSARALPEYEALVGEIAKLQSPAEASSVDWGRIVEAGQQILSSSSKDLAIAAYLAAGWQVANGLLGFFEGSVLLGELLALHWAGLFPERPKGRINALAWFVERGMGALSDPGAAAADRELLLALQESLKRLAALSREKLAQDSPGFGPLLQTVERLLLSAPSPKAAAKAATPATPLAANVLPAGNDPAPSASVDRPKVEVEPLPVLPATVDGDYLREMGSRLVDAALRLRQANRADPAPYRLLRSALWLHLDGLPPRNAQGRTSLPPVPAAKLSQLSQLETHAKWAELIEEAEGQLVSSRFNLDLHRYTVRALEQLGPDHRPARQAAIAELGSWLTRQPLALELSFQDGSPAADAATRQWIDSQVRQAGEGAAAESHKPAAPDAQADEQLALETRARQLIAKGQSAEAFRLVEQRLASASTEPARFRWRLLLAQLCAEADQLPAARALFLALDEQSQSHRLDAWDPELSRRCLEGLLRCARAGRGGGVPPPEFTAQFQRLCQLSLVGALSTQG